MLYPEDNTAAEEQLEHVTVENIVTNNLYDDLGFTIGESNHSGGDAVFM